MRGKPTVMKPGTPFYRITPADAGKTRLNTFIRFTSLDHPRGCGENLAVGDAAAVKKGSPPRMRGKPRQCGLRSLSWRITPADAGKTGLSEGERQASTDHPRGCGENAFLIGRMMPRIGSPPRMRGKRMLRRRRLHPLRITPADAGKTE